MPTFVVSRPDYTDSDNILFHAIYGHQPEPYLSLEPASRCQEDWTDEGVDLKDQFGGWKPTE